jgi:hypothetical protein
MTYVSGAVYNPGRLFFSPARSRLWPVRGPPRTPDARWRRSTGGLCSRLRRFASASMGRNLRYVGEYLHFLRFFQRVFSLSRCGRAGCVFGTVFAYYIVMSNHANKENAMNKQTLYRVKYLVNGSWKETPCTYTKEQAILYATALNNSGLKTKLVKIISLRALIRTRKIP